MVTYLGCGYTALGTNSAVLYMTIGVEGGWMKQFKLPLTQSTCPSSN